MEVLRGLIDPCYNAETIIRPGELPVRSSEVLIWHLAAMAPVDLSKEPCLHAAAVSSLHFHDPVQPSSCLGALVRLMGASGPPTSPSWAPTRRLGGDCGVKKLEKLIQGLGYPGFEEHAQVLVCAGAGAGAGAEPLVIPEEEQYRRFIQANQSWIQTTGPVGVGAGAGAGACAGVGAGAVMYASRCLGNVCLNLSLILWCERTRERWAACMEALGYPRVMGCLLHETSGLSPGLREPLGYPRVSGGLHKKLSLIPGFERTTRMSPGYGQPAQNIALTTWISPGFGRPPQKVPASPRV